MSKEKLRKQALKIRRSLSKDHVTNKSRAIIERLLSLDEYVNARTIMPYVSLDDEVDTREFIKDKLEEKNIVVPFVSNDGMGVSKLSSFSDLEEGGFGVLEPARKEEHTGEIDMVLIPGVAFDEYGGRIGFGKGYYDKFLRDSSGLKIALAFEEQIVDKVPAEDHDVNVDMIITDKRVIRCR